MFSNWNINIAHYEYLNPTWFWGLMLVPILLFLMVRIDQKRKGDWKFNGVIQDKGGLQSMLISILRFCVIALPVLSFALLMVAMAKPYSWQQSDQKHEENKYGIDIIIAMDVSLSMLAQDFQPNRLTVAKEVAVDFINGRKGDKIGLVQYAGEAYTSCPPTLDYPILIEQLNKADGMEMEPGTAIGTGLGTAVVQLRDEKLKSKVIILLTDGSNNSGELSPMDAALLAKEKNICVYTIGIGTNGIAPTPVLTPSGIAYENMPVEIDEQTLNQIATSTGGMYFRANNEEALRNIYQQIEAMEKRKITHKIIQSDPPATPQAFLNWALVLLMSFGLITRLFFIPDLTE